VAIPLGGTREPATGRTGILLLNMFKDQVISTIHQ
jgi:hypothetical protein